MFGIGRKRSPDNVAGQVFNSVFTSRLNDPRKAILKDAAGQIAVYFYNDLFQ